MHMIEKLFTNNILYYLMKLILFRGTKIFHIKTFSWIQQVCVSNGSVLHLSVWLFCRGKKNKHLVIDLDVFENQVI